MGSIQLLPDLEADERLLTFSMVQSGGPGGQNVNKVATAVLLRFRYNECETLSDGMKARLRENFSGRINSLGELTEREFEDHKDAIRSDVRAKRARHAVYENQRTIRALHALQENDIALFGRLINESHCSLRDDFEVSCRECDILAELAWSLPGVLGSRITGGGFGGCTVSIVKKDAVKE